MLMHSYEPNGLFVQTINDIAIEFFVRILIGVSVLYNREVERWIVRECEKGLPNHFDTQCIDRGNRIFQMVAWPIFNVPTSLQITVLPHLESRIWFSGPFWTLQMVADPLFHV